MAARPRVCFIHVPKCAGTAVRSAIESQYPRLQRHGLSASKSRSTAARAGVPVRVHRAALLRRHLGSRRLRFVSGHYPAVPEILERWREQWHFVTVLRDPVERTLSNYFFNRHKPGDHYATAREIESYFAPPGGISRCRAYLSFFAVEAVDAPIEERIACAKRTLERFRLIGITENLEPFGEGLARLGLDVAFRRANENPLDEKERATRVSPELRARLEEWSAPDREIYEHARVLASRPT